MSSDNRKQIPPRPPRWVPNQNPSLIDVPGLDTNASVNDQIEQIEQLITIKLQNIDENFSKIHNVLANKVLPAVKKYAVATEPVREAAKFWTAFYEQAAQIRIPASEDYSTVNDQQSERSGETNPEQSQEQDTSPFHITQPENFRQSEESYETSTVSTENSFLPSNAAYSSTPATNRKGRTADASAAVTSSEESWSASLESPLVRLDREIQNFSREDDSLIPFDQPTLSDPPRSPEKGEGKSRDESNSLLRTVMHRNIADVSSTTPSLMRHTSPLRPRTKLKTPIPKSLNPFLPPESDPSEWNGVVDLRDRTVLTPHRSRRYTPKRNPMTPADEPEEEDSWDGEGLPPGMSPPVLMSPARPSRPVADLGLGRTPSRDVTARITRDLIQGFQRKPLGNVGVGSYVESSMSTVPTPPSLSRYHGSDSGTIMGDSTLEREMETLELHNTRPVVHYTPAQGYSPPDDSFDDDEVNNTAHPSAAFLMASSLRPSADDSFSSSEQDSLDADDRDMEGIEPVHPFARAGIQFDSFDDDDESFDSPVQSSGTETLFGLQPRIEDTGDPGNLRIHGARVFDDTTGLSLQLGRVEESPTPAGWSRR